MFCFFQLSPVCLLIFACLLGCASLVAQKIKNSPAMWEIWSSLFVQTKPGTGRPPLVLAAFLVLTLVFSILSQNTCGPPRHSSFLTPTALWSLHSFWRLEMQLSLSFTNKMRTNSLCFTFSFLLGCFRMFVGEGKCCFYTLFSTEVPLDNFQRHICHAASW